MTKKVKIATGIIALFYVSGLIGMIIPDSRSWFLSLTPLNLLLTAGLYIWASNDYTIKTGITFITLFLIGFFIEVAGVHTGILFGEYNYGAPLGWKLWDVPLTIGINWFLLGLSSYSVLSHLFKNKLVVITGSSLLMTLLDVLIEPVAIKLDFWSWTLITPPLQNYLMWFAVAFVIHFLLTVIKPKTNFKMSLVILASQIFFFGGLSITL